MLVFTCFSKFNTIKFIQRKSDDSAKELNEVSFSTTELNKVNYRFLNNYSNITAYVRNQITLFFSRINKHSFHKIVN
jgi:hypothetical protein